MRNKRMLYFIAGFLALVILLFVVVKSIAFVLPVSGENGIAVLETVDRMAQDTGEVMKYLLEKLDRPKLFLIGHLWGSMLGVLAVQEYPEYIYAYTGSGQDIYAVRGEKISYAYALGKAGESGNAQAVKELKQISATFEIRN